MSLRREQATPKQPPTPARWSASVRDRVGDMAPDSHLSTSSENPPLHYARAYAARGLRVVPIKPQAKRPPMYEWGEEATTDPSIIENWYTGLYRHHGVGLAMGRQPDGRFIFALDVDEHDPAQSGGETLAEWESGGRSLPETVRALTAGGGVHLLFLAPGDVEVRNGKPGPGLDIRGQGGQIAVAPTQHPTLACKKCLAGDDHPLAPYEWEAGFAPWEHDIAFAPQWLLDLVADDGAAAPRPASRPSQPTGGPQWESPVLSPADWLRQRWNWPLQLREAGWVEHHVDRRTGDVHWTRPGKDPRAGASGVLHVPDGPFVLFSTDGSVDAFRRAGTSNTDGSVSLSPLQWYAAHRHAGDERSAARVIRAMMDQEQKAMPPTASHLSAQQQVTAGALPQRKVRLTPASAIGVRSVRWLWDGRIAVGTLALLAGPEGLGKSTLAYWLAARVTRGELPGEDHERPRSVLVCATEDSWEHTINPRLMAHGADQSRVFRLDVTTDGGVNAELVLPADLADMEMAAAEVDASLLILDPLMSRLNVGLDAHRDGEVRQALEPLVASCSRSRIACLGLIHHNKSGATNPLDLVMASKAFTAVARSVHTAIRDPEDDTGDTRLFGTIKNNLGRMDLPVRTFTIESWSYPTDDGRIGTTGRLEWGADSTTSIQTALSRAASSGKTSAVDWLRDYMAKNGPRVNAADVFAAADDAELTRRAVQRAYQKLRLDRDDVGGIGRGRQTYWFDPNDSRLGGAVDSHLSDDDTPSLEDIT